MKIFQCNEQEPDRQEVAGDLSGSNKENIDQTSMGGNTENADAR